MARLAAPAPFIAAILFYLVTPLIARQVQRALRGELAEGGRHAPNLDTHFIPYYLTQSAISDYLEFATDAVQVIPAVLLPVVGAIYALGNGVPPVISISFLVAVCLAAFALNAWMFGHSASDYASKKWYGYSVMTLTGVSINIIGLLIIVFLLYLSGLSLDGSRLGVPVPS
jgi:hypothetical protein